MTTPLVSAFPKVQPSSGSSVGYRTQRRASGLSASYMRNKSAVEGHLDNASTSKNSNSLGCFLTSLLESVQGGLLVMTQNLLPVYTNRRAKEICEQISNGKGDAGRGLPAVIIQSCQRFLREGAVNCEPLVVEYQTPQRQTIRLQIRWLDPSLESDCAHEQSRPYVLILLENCHTALEAELRLDCQKYELTDREAEIWMLLRKEYTYQEIAELLNISLNTVKTHVKNVYAKRKSSSEQGKVWYSR